VTIGHGCATVGSRSLGRRGLGVDATAALIWRGEETIGTRSRKPAAAGAGRAKGKEGCDVKR